MSVSQILSPDGSNSSAIDISERVRQQMSNMCGRQVSMAQSEKYSPLDGAGRSLLYATRILQSSVTIRNTNKLQNDASIHLPVAKISLEKHLKRSLDLVPSEEREKFKTMLEQTRDAVVNMQSVIENLGQTGTSNLEEKYLMAKELIEQTGHALIALCGRLIKANEDRAGNTQPAAAPLSYEAGCGSSVALSEADKKALMPYARKVEKSHDQDVTEVATQLREKGQTKNLERVITRLEAIEKNIQDAISSIRGDLKDRGSLSNTELKTIVSGAQEIRQQIAELVNLAGQIEGAHAELQKNGSKLLEVQQRVFKALKIDRSLFEFKAPAPALAKLRELKADIPQEQKKVDAARSSLPALAAKIREVAGKYNEPLTILEGLSSKNAGLIRYNFAVAPRNVEMERLNGEIGRAKDQLVPSADAIKTGEGKLQQDTATLSKYVHEMKFGL